MELSDNASEDEDDVLKATDSIMAQQMKATEMFCFFACEICRLFELILFLS